MIDDAKLENAMMEKAVNDNKKNIGTWAKAISLIHELRSKNMREIKVKYHADIEPLKKFQVGDWIDLRSAEDVTIKEGGFKLISLGVSMQLPEGYEAHVLPRSSTWKNFGIIMTNGMGIIDNSYNGNDDVWKFPALAFRQTSIRKGDRIAQFRIVRSMGSIQFDPVEDLGNDGRGGFGSTGVK